MKKLTFFPKKTIINKLLFAFILLWGHLTFAKNNDSIKTTNKKLLFYMNHLSFGTNSCYYPFSTTSNGNKATGLTNGFLVGYTINPVNHPKDAMDFVVERNKFNVYNNHTRVNNPYPEIYWKLSVGYTRRFLKDNNSPFFVSIGGNLTFGNAAMEREINLDSKNANKDYYSTRIKIIKNPVPAAYVSFGKYLRITNNLFKVSINASFAPDKVDIADITYVYFVDAKQESAYLDEHVWYKKSYSKRDNCFI
jgi:hypothetical protein